MIGGCAAAGSVDAMFTFSPVGLSALFGLTVALNATVTAAKAAGRSQQATSADAEHGYELLTQLLLLRGLQGNGAVSGTQNCERAALSTNPQA